VFLAPQAVTVTVQVVVTGTQEADAVATLEELVTFQRASRSLAMAAPTRAEVRAKKRILMYYLLIKRVIVFVDRGEN